MLNAWNIPLTGDELSQATRDIQKSWNTLVSWQLIGLGAAMILVGLLHIPQLLLTSGPQISHSVLMQPTIAIEVFSLLIGFGAGYLHGLWQLRRQSPDRLAYGDLRPKRLTDYHSLAIQCIPVCSLIYTSVLLLVSMPYWKEHITIQMISGTYTVLPSWVVWIVPCLGVLLIVVAERFLWLVATFPRLLISTNLPLSAKIDDMLRSLVSALILATEYATIGVMNYMQAFTLLWRGARTPDYVFYIALISVFLSCVLLISGFALVFLGGRLGGNINGWPWQYTKSQDRRKPAMLISSRRTRFTLAIANAIVGIIAIALYIMQVPYRGLIFFLVYMPFCITILILLAIQKSSVRESGSSQ